MDRQQVQRAFWGPVYDRLAHMYDAVDWFTGNTAHRLRRHALAYLPPTRGRVLEIGFGSGKLHLELATRHNMYGLDMAPGMARLARRRLLASGLSPALCVGNACALPWPEDTFDAVLSTFALSAIPDAARALDEMARVTRPGGKVIVVDAGEAMDGNRTARLLAWLWVAFGDYMRDEVPLMRALGLSTARTDFGPWNSVHVTVGTVPADL